MTTSKPICTILSDNEPTTLKDMYNALDGFSVDFELSDKTELVLLDLCSDKKAKIHSGFITNSEKTEIPYTMILGIEESLDYYDRFLLSPLKDILEPLRLLTHGCGPNYCRYFSLNNTIGINVFLNKKIKESSQNNGQSMKLKNPFVNIPKVKELQSKIYTPQPNRLSDFLNEAGKYAVPEYRKKQRLKEFHTMKRSESLSALQFYDLAVANIKFTSQERKKFNVLLIENKPDGKIEELKELNLDNIKRYKSSKLESCLTKIEELFEGYKFWIYKNDFPFLKDKLNSVLDDKENKQKVEVEIFKKAKLINDNSNKANHKGGDLDFNNIDLILIDIFLEEEAELNGLDFLKLFTLLYPEIPAFIMSGSEDTEVIGDAIKGKADYYILKKNMFSLPFIYYKYLDDLGALIQYIKDPDLKRSLIGNLRYWRYKKDFLWFGDKCYHMVNHSYDHVGNDWNIANQIVPHLLDTLKDQDQSLSDEEIYAFCMAIWLHDIGHKGNDHYGEPHEIRDLHGLISAELVMKHPESYGCYGYLDRKASPYRWANFGAPKTAPQLIMERMATLEAAGRMVEEKHRTEAKDIEKVDNNRHYFYDHIQKVTILEKICLLCIYHKSNFPLDDDDFKKIRENGKRIPLDCYCNKNKNTTPIHLKSITTTINDANLLKLVALFRFIDGMDINQNRVGDNTEEGIKKRTIERDLKYQILKLKDEVNRICQTYLKNTGKEKRFFTLFYERSVKNINEERRITDDLKMEQERFLDTLATELNLENWMSEITAFTTSESFDEEELYLENWMTETFVVENELVLENWMTEIFEIEEAEAELELEEWMLEPFTKAETFQEEELLLEKWMLSKF